MRQTIAFERGESTSVLKVERPSETNHNRFDHLPFGLIRKESRSKTASNMYKVLVIDRSERTSVLLKHSLSPFEDETSFHGAIKRYEILRADSHESASKIISCSLPDLIVADWDTITKSIPKESSVCTYTPFHLPVLFLIDRNMAHPKIGWRNITSGIVDCIQKPIDITEIRSRINMLLGFTEKIKALEEETTAIKDNLNLKHLELHLELLIHSGSVKDKFLEDVHQLSPFLTVEGRTKLKHMVKQFRWALNDEKSTNYIRAFDNLNEDLYKQLENVCSSITKNEKRLCAFTLKDQTGSEIAKVMGKTQNCINVAFARLRSKLGLNNNKDLKAFLLNLIM